MFSGRRKNKAKRKEKKNKEDTSKKKLPLRKKDLNFSWWTPWRSIKASVAVVSMGLAAGGLIYHCDSIVREDPYAAVHAEAVRSEFSTYDDYSTATKPLETCLTPGSELRVIKDSIVVMGIQSDRKNMTIENLVKFENPHHENDKRPFIRPVDGGQDVLITSDVYVRGIDYSDVEGLLRNRKTGLEIRPKMPDIMPTHFAIDFIEINSKNIPLRYVEARRHDDLPFSTYYYLDILKLVDDDFLSEKDFKDGLDVRVISSVEIGEMDEIYEDEIAGMFAYKSMPKHFRRYMEAIDAYPADHDMIKGIVKAYDGDFVNALDVVEYALKVTDNLLEYPKRDAEGNQIETIGESVMESINVGRGVCRQYVNLFVTILRAFGVPARYARGETVDYAEMKFGGPHAWTEVLLPFKDNTYRWVHVEPTWADKSYDPSNYINFVDRRYLYGLDFDVKFDTSDINSRFHLLQHHRLVSTPQADLDAEIDDRVEMPPLDMIVKKKGEDKK